MPYITTVLSENFEDSLFQIAALSVFGKVYQKQISIPKQNEFVRNSKMFSDDKVDNFHILKANDIIIPFESNIYLDEDYASFKYYTKAVLEYIREFVYHNEDYMYDAYEKYNKIKGNLDDDDFVSIYHSGHNNNLAYYKKSIILANKKNIVLFSPDASNLMKIFDDDHNVQVIWDDNIYVRFILLSFFQNNIVDFYNPRFSLWAAYVSKYKSCKNVVVPESISSIINEHINNMYFITC